MSFAPNICAGDSICGYSSAVERHVANVNVVSSILIARSNKCACGGMADTLVLGTSASAWGFKSLQAHHL